METSPISLCLQAGSGYSASSSCLIYVPTPHVRSPTAPGTLRLTMLPGWFRPVLSTFVSPLIRIIFFYLFVCCQYFRFVLVDCHHMLEVSRGSAVRSADRPSVLFLNNIFSPHVDHRLDGHHHSGYDLR